ncbi:TOMM precursor leader peptide-binding protein [Chitinophaga sp. Hz27]|uniref:TOMM precursor leader peptide-binding protein n=1 Tax=Chitinophaga sp. Hz27 TaxID=3347169 RepID=UPI0035E13C4F
METQWIDEKLRIAPHKNFIITSDETAYMVDCYEIKPIHGRLQVGLLQAIQQQSAAVAELLQQLQRQFFAPYLLITIEKLLDDGIIDKEHNETTTAVNSIDFPIGDTVITLVQQRNLQEALAIWQETIVDGKSWLPVFVDAGLSFVGPVFHSDSTACPVCLLDSMRLKEYNFPTPQQVPQSLVHTIHEIITGKGIIYSADHLHKIEKANSVIAYALQKRPECSACGNRSMMEATMLAPLSLKDTSVIYRGIAPEETWQRYKHHINPITGVIREFHIMSREAEQALFCYGAIIAGNVFGENITAYGKGNTEIAAKVSCLCEAIERHSAAFRGDEPLLEASVNQLGVLAIPPTAIQHFAAAQLQSPAHTMALGPVPIATDENTIISWAPAWSLTKQERRYVPADAVFYNIPHTKDTRPAIFESNGLAAGNTLQEAILQGLLELIERDATAVWWYNRLHRPPAPVSLLQNDTWFQQAMAQLQAAGWEVTLLDLTIDTAMPVVAAIGCIDRAYLIGYGCHFSMEGAMIRALTELIQVRAIMGPVPPPERRSLDYLCAHDASKKFPGLTINSNRVGDISQHIIRHLETLNIETIVVNCSRPDAGLPVVKVFTPGLRSFRPRFGAGRLYDIPVTLGLQTVSTPYEQLTPMWLTSSRSLSKPW